MTPFDLRQGLLAAGYVPLPAKGKAVLLKAWSRVKVTTEEVERWSREMSWLPNTGIRCDNLVAIDIDVTDKPLANEIFRLARDRLGDQALARVGRAPKVLLLYRAAKGGSRTKIATGRYRDAQGAAHAVEVLRGAGCQFVGFGTHPDTQQPYRWLGAGPLATPARDLPALTDAQVRDFLDEVHATFKDRGLTHEDTDRDPLGADFPRVYDLEDDTEIELLGEDFSGPWTVTAIEGVLAKLDPGTTIRCTLSAFREGADGDNGCVGLCGDGFLRVSDYVERVVHLRPVIDRTELDEDARTALLGEGRAAFEELTSSWAYVASEEKCFDIEAPTGDGYTVTAAKRLFRQVTFEEEEVVAKWLRSKDAHRVHRRQFSPRHVGERIFREGRERVLNTYVPPRWDRIEPDARGTQVWADFMGHLLPDSGERDLFLDWLANKIQRPWERMFGVLMVADGVFGTGRGTLSAVMGDLLGKDYVLGVPFDIFSGTSNQAQYYDWLAGTLMVCVGEALESQHGPGGFVARNRAFERLKEIIEPGNGVNTYLPRKQIKAKIGDIFTSIFVATNHSESIAVPEGDRRLAVLSNGRPLTEQLRRAIHGPAGLRATPGQLAAVAQELATRDIRSDLLAAPMMTDAKRRLVASNVSDLDEAFSLFTQTVDAAVFTSSQFRRFCTILSMTHDVDIPQHEDLDKVLRGRFLAAQGCRQERHWPRFRTVVAGAPKQVRVVLTPGRKLPLELEQDAGRWRVWAEPELQKVDEAIDAFATAESVEVS